MMFDMASLQAWAKEQLPRALFLTVSGTELYGLTSPDNYVCVRGSHSWPLQQVLGLVRYPPRKVEARGRLAEIDVKLISYEIWEYLWRLAKHDLYTLEQVFSPRVVLGKEFLDQLRPLAARCISRHCYHDFCKDLDAQLQRLEKESIKRIAILLPAYRIVLTGIHLLRTGQYQVNLTELNQQFNLTCINELMRRERGTLMEHEYDLHRLQMEKLKSQLDKAFVDSNLPEAPPLDELNSFLIDLRLKSSELRDYLNKEP
jgi:predicted nucleotidyltransferase